jgi:hypothetical protein
MPDWLTPCVVSESAQPPVGVLLATIGSTGFGVKPVTATALALHVQTGCAACAAVGANESSIPAPTATIPATW